MVFSLHWVIAPLPLETSSSQQMLQVKWEWSGREDISLSQQSLPGCGKKRVCRKKKKKTKLKTNLNEELSHLRVEKNPSAFNPVLIIITRLFHLSPHSTSVNVYLSETQNTTLVKYSIFIVILNVCSMNTCILLFLHSFVFSLLTHWIWEILTCLNFKCWWLDLELTAILIIHRWIGHFLTFRSLARSIRIFFQTLLMSTRNKKRRQSSVFTFAKVRSTRNKWGHTSIVAKWERKTWSYVSVGATPLWVPNPLSLKITVSSLLSKSRLYDRQI